MQGWLTNTNQVDEIGEDFFKGCFEAGSKLCPLSHEKDSSASHISDRTWAWIMSLDEEPLTMPTNDGTNILIRSGDIRTLFRWTMYNANYLFRPFSTTISNAMNGNTGALFKEFYDLFRIAPNESACSKSTVAPLIAEDQQSAIVCIDGEDTTHLKVSDWRNYLEDQLKVSSIAGAFWATLRISCAGWTARPNWLFKGPYTTPEPSKVASSPEHGRPAAPLFFTSTRQDPATPPANARAMAKGHPGAGVMIQKSTGHCIVLGPMGACAKNAMANYLDTGEVPSEELVCEDTRGPWEGDASEHVSPRLQSQWVL